MGYNIEMRIGIDARFYGSVGKGLGRYTQKLIENLEKIDSSDSADGRQYFVFLRKENFEEYQPQSKNFHKVLADFRWYTFSEQINMPRLLYKYRLDLVHFPHFNVPLFYRRKFVITIHDLILIHFPTIRGTALNPVFYWLKFLAYKLVINSAIHRSQKIIAVSEFTKKDILGHYRVPAEKIKVTYEAADDFCFINPAVNEAKILAFYGIIKPYIIYVGNVYPHKNPERLIEGFGMVNEKFETLKLVFVGGEDYFYRRLKNFVRAGNRKNIIFAGFVPDAELDILNKNAFAYVRPSLYEGFELPPLEAMLKGVPVICSDHNCAREVLGDAAYYFDGSKAEAICSAIERVIEDGYLRNDLIRKGYEQVKKYNWQKMAKITLDIYLDDRQKNKKK